MSIAIISDIHSNLEALQTAIRYIDKHKIDSVYCLGDSVGYCAQPNECLQIIRDRCKVVLLGNHDQTAADLNNIDYFNDYARTAAIWTNRELTDESKTYLKGLPASYSEGNLRLAHSAPREPLRWHYILSLQAAQAEMKGYAEQVCFIGHSHVPVVFGMREEYGVTEMRLQPDIRYIVNVGSIGQPRDGDPRLCFVIYDEERAELRYIRLEYDVQTTRQKILGQNLPAYLAERLLNGY